MLVIYIFAIQQVLVREKDPAIYYEYWLPRQAQLYRMTVDAFASDAQHVVSARPTTLAPTTATSQPTTMRPIRTTVRPTSTTTAAAVAFRHHNTSTEIDLNDWDQYEPQPTAASLVRSPPRMTYGHILAPFFTSPTTATSTTPRTTTTTTTSPAPTTKKERSKGSNKKVNDHHNIDQVRSHLGLIHKKHPKSSVVRSGGGHGLPSCSVDGSCWKTVNGKKHFCLSEFGNSTYIINSEQFTDSLTKLTCYFG